MGNAQACCSSDSGADSARSLWDITQEEAGQDVRLEATPPPCDGTLTVNVVSCSDLVHLPSSRSGGKAPDTYVRLHLGAANQIKQQTAVVERSCSPSFDESFTFRLAGGSSHAACTLFVAVMLKGRMGIRASNDLLGEAQLSLRDVFCGRWSERVGGEWALRDDFTRGVAKQQRTELSSGQGGLGTVELQLRFRPDVPAGLGLQLMPRSTRSTAILPPRDGKAIQHPHRSSDNANTQLVVPPADGWLRVHIRNCTGLLPTGGGTTDSFASISVAGGESVRTNVQHQTLSPRFDQGFEFFLDRGAPPGSCVLLIKLKSTTDDFLGELELQPCAEFAQSNWKRRVKREFTLTDRLNRAPAREKKKRSHEPCPCGTVSLTLSFKPTKVDGLEAESEDAWRGMTPAKWRSGYVRPDRDAKAHAEAVRAGRLPPTHVH